MSNETKSPIKEPPLRQPGQSLAEARQEIIDEKLMPLAYVALMVMVLALNDWWQYLRPAPQKPVMTTAVAFLVIGICFWRFRSLRPKLRAIRQGIEGEKAVGEFLERMREGGYRVFHDVLGGGFNIDHVLIGPAGIFAIETKTWSKPLKGEARIVCDGETCAVSGGRSDRGPIKQARAQAAWLKEKLTESTGREVVVFPVVVFPGWFIENSEGALQKIWVLEPKALPKFLENQPERLSSEDIHLFSFHLSRLIRSGEQEARGKLLVSDSYQR